MNDFLDQVFFDNTVRSYLLVGVIILVMLVVKHYIAHYAAGLIFIFVKSVWKDVDKRSFTNLVTRPLGFFLAVLVILATLYKLKFPEHLNFDIYRISLLELLHIVGSLVLIISFVRLLLKMIDFIAVILHIRADRVHDNSDNQLVVFFKDFFKVIICVIGILMILKFSFGLNIGNLLTGLSIVGAAIALALRESLENLIASFIIFFDKPFSTGDVVKVHNFVGTVEKIGLRSTRIRTDQKTMISVPNKQMVDSILDNLSQRTQRRGDLKLEIGLSATSSQMESLVAGIRKIVNREEVENSTVLLSEISASAFIVTTEYFTGPVTMQEFNRVKEDINFRVLRLVEETGAEISGASTDVKIISEKSL